MPTQTQKWIGIAISAVIVVAILSVPIHDTEEVETYYSYEPLAFRETLVREKQVRRICFPWFCEKTEVQYRLRNIDDYPGQFSLNIIFDNGTNTDTVTESVNINAGEEVSVSIVSPLKGQSAFELNTIAPKKAIPHKRVVPKKVNTFSQLDELWRFRLLRR